MDGTSTLPGDTALDQRLLALSGDLLGAVGPDGRLRFGNPAWSAALGWSDEQLRATEFLDLVAADDRAAAGAALDAGDGRLALRMLCAQGGERFVRWEVRRADDDGVLVAGRDITDYERLEHELQEFVYTASHDLVEPLRMITSYLELLQRRYAGQLDETADQFIGFAVGGAERMKALIDDLLAYSRVGSRELQIARLDLGELVATARRGMEAEIELAGASLEVASPLPAACGDPVLVAQLLSQLLHNAVKFRSPARPALVSVAAVESDGGVRLDVADNGLGIDPAQHERVFKMFARLHGRDEYEGTGIGLALCRRIVDRHGGRIWLDSSPDAGATFHAWLPGRS